MIKPTAEMHIATDPEFVTKYGKRVRDTVAPYVGNRLEFDCGDSRGYKDARGHSTCRFVFLPCGPDDDFELIKAIVSEFPCSRNKTTIVIRFLGRSEVLYVAASEPAEQIRSRLLASVERIAREVLRVREGLLEGIRIQLDKARKAEAVSSEILQAVRLFGASDAAISKCELEAAACSESVQHIEREQETQNAGVSGVQQFICSLSNNDTYSFS